MFIEDEAPKWSAMISNYLIKDSPHRVICVVFENLEKDLIGEVKRMLDFLKISYTDEEIRRQLQQDFTTFKRRRKKVFSHYTYHQRLFINSIIRSTMSLLEGTYIATQIPLHSYLHVY